ncbi:hypothetical protein [Bradyrhizobium sp. Leo170]|uniref:hypothetical protein n=1 Tax=Bradyrhizobium sp. Leo170 TaxID=1571199 RepID=UPI00102EC56F|nr:hypothetical protein [Bradyrhizobium sp. Leo170]TAI63874.1 hypothetical protein CWO89_21815 [Bradyrhizobium sp. Leo170]
MQYNQPYGVSDPNAPYLNGNPATGQAGSIPPAASIEYPQREIVALINKNGITPANSDLTQLAQSVQQQKPNYGVDAGTANAYQVTLDPAPTAYRDGLTVRMLVTHSPTGPSVLNVNALGPKPIKKRSGKDIQAGEFWAGDVIELVYDGSVFFVIGANAVSMLSASLDYYVATTGSDTLNDGLTPGTPFATVQHAINVTMSFNLNGYQVTIHVANGVYNGQISLPLMNGSGAVKITGNPGSPGSVQFTHNLGTTILCAGPGYWLEGCKISCTAGNPAVGDNGNCLWSHGNNGGITVNNIEWGVAAYGQIVATDGGTVGLTGSHTISGSATYHFWCQVNSLIILNPVTRPTWNIPAPASFSGAFCYTSMLGVWVNPMGTTTGYGNVTGKKYQADMNSTIVTGQGVNHFPGNVAGATSTGGQYM